MSTIEKVKEEILLDELVEINNEIVLYNDDVNTFSHVIKSLVEVCGHDSVQAEQCALIVHLKGKCEIKSGIKEVLQAMSRSLNAKGLNSKVENQF